MASVDGASSIQVTIRVRPFTIKEAAQLTKCDDTTVFLGDGSLATAPPPKLSQKGIRNVLKVVDDRCLLVNLHVDGVQELTTVQYIRPSRRQSCTEVFEIFCAIRQESERHQVWV